MKYIHKNGEPQSFTDWKQLANEDWQPSWLNFQEPQKSEVKNSLLEEQGSICCYCEKDIQNTESHIEHIKPRSNPDYCGAELEYGNLLCSCGPSQKKGAPSHCGDKKGDWFNEHDFITPLVLTCEDRFSYTAHGEIIPKRENDNAAIVTIEKLGLNISSLVALRKARIDVFLDPDIDADDQKAFLTNYTARNSDGGFNEFWTTANHFLINSFA